MFFTLFPVFLLLYVLFLFSPSSGCYYLSELYYDPLYTGTNLTITCDITLTNLVDIPVIVSNEWTRNGSEITETTVTEDLFKVNNLNYMANLEFFPLNALTDDGEYKCSVGVIPSVMDEDDYLYITNVTNNTSTTLDVLSEFIVGLVKITVILYYYNSRLLACSPCKMKMH